MQSVEDLGVLDTFAFEERCFLRVFVKAALAGELGKAQKLTPGLDLCEAHRPATGVEDCRAGPGCIWPLGRAGIELRVASGWRSSSWMRCVMNWSWRAC